MPTIGVDFKIRTIDVDGKGMAWTNLWMTDQVARYNPADGKWTLFDLPTLAITRHGRFAEWEQHVLTRCVTVATAFAALLAGSLAVAAASLAVVVWLLTRGDPLYGYFSLFIIQQTL